MRKVPTYSPTRSPSRTAAGTHPQLGRFRWTWGDCAFVALIWFIIIAGAIRKNEWYALWIDEVLAFNLITDPSLLHMLFALGDQADGGAPLYYLLARLWTQVFGA